MSAHLRPFKTACDTRGCTSRATVSAFNTYNAHLGNHCGRHGGKILKELLAGERIAAAKPTPTESTSGFGEL